MAAGFVAKPVEPEQWVESVCSSLGRWSENLADARQAADLDAPDLADRKDALVVYLEAVTDATKRLVRQLKDAGAPDVDDGKEVAGTFRKGLEQARAGFADALALARDLRTRNPKRFRAAVADIGDRVAGGADAVERTFDVADRKYDDEKLDVAFANEPACAGIA